MSDQDLTTELNDAVADLQDALQHAVDASARIKNAIPQLTRISSVFDELESIIDAGRRISGAAPEARGEQQIARTRPTLVVPDAPQRRSKRPAAAAEPEAPAPGIDAQIESLEETPDEAPGEWEATPPAAPAIAASPQTSDEPTTTFRLEFESRPGPLDLRAVDDAVSQHPAVRDVALIDYDGRRATLKVWIVATASPAEVQETLAARTAEMASNGSEISIVALEDVA